MKFLILYYCMYNFNQMGCSSVNSLFVFSLLTMLSVTVQWGPHGIGCGQIIDQLSKTICNLSNKQFVCVYHSCLLCLYHLSYSNTVIWITEIVAVLKGHTGLVKGVTWDPVGKYLSSQSDDRSLRIWRTVDWQQEAVIKKPFKDVICFIHLESNRV